MAQIVRHTRNPKSNATEVDKRAIKELNADKAVVVLKADKDSATVILKKTDYKNKIIDPLRLGFI